MERRRFIEASGLVALSSLAGCPSPLGGKQYVYFVSVFNYTDEPHRIDVTAWSSGDEVLFERSFELGPEDVVEDVQLSNRPDIIRVGLDDGSGTTLDWPNSEYCNEKGMDGRSGLSLVVSHPSGGTDEEELFTEWTCQAIQA